MRLSDKATNAIAIGNTIDQFIDDFIDSAADRGQSAKEAEIIAFGAMALFILNRWPTRVDVFCRALKEAERLHTEESTK